MYKTTNTIYVVSRTNNPDELLHYGIKGMKWGKHKSTYTLDYQKKIKTNYQKEMIVLVSKIRDYC